MLHFHYPLKTKYLQFLSQTVRLGYIALVYRLEKLGEEMSHNVIKTTQLSLTEIKL